MAPPGAPALAPPSVAPVATEVVPGPGFVTIGEGAAAGVLAVMCITEGSMLGLQKGLVLRVPTLEPVPSGRVRFVAPV